MPGAWAVLAFATTYCMHFLYGDGHSCQMHTLESWVCSSEAVLPPLFAQPLRDYTYFSGVVPPQPRSQSALRVNSAQTTV